MDPATAARIAPPAAQPARCSVCRAATAPLALTLAAATLCPTLAAGTVTLQNGDRIKGSILTNSDDGLYLQHKTLGQLTLDQTQVKAVAYSHTDPAYEGNALDHWFFPGWDKSLEIGFSGTDGNTDTLNFYAAFSTKQTTERDRWDIQARYFLTYDEGDQTRDEGNAFVIKDWLVPDEDYFYFGTARYDHDRFSGYEDRFSGFLGVGYDFIDDGVWAVTGRLGAGGNYEAGAVNEFTPEALVGIEATWTIDENQEFHIFNNLYPAFDPLFGEFRNVSGAEYKVKLAAGRGLSLKLGIENEYLSEVEEGTEHNNLNYFGALVYDF